MKKSVLTIIVVVLLGVLIFSFYPTINSWIKENITNKPVEAEITHKIIATGNSEYLSIKNKNNEDISINDYLIHGEEITIDVKEYPSSMEIKEFMVNNINFMQIKNNTIKVETDVIISLIIEPIITAQICVNCDEQYYSEIQIWQMRPVDEGGPRIINTEPRAYFADDSDIKLQYGDIICITAIFNKGYEIDSVTYMYSTNEGWFVNQNYNLEDTIVLNGHSYVFDFTIKENFKDVNLRTEGEYSKDVLLQFTTSQGGRIDLNSNSSLKLVDDTYIIKPSPNKLSNYYNYGYIESCDLYINDTMISPESEENCIYIIDISEYSESINIVVKNVEWNFGILEINSPNADVKLIDKNTGLEIELNENNQLKFIPELNCLIEVTAHEGYEFQYINFNYDEVLLNTENNNLIIRFGNKLIIMTVHCVEINN